MKSVAGRVGSGTSAYYFVGAPVKIELEGDALASLTTRFTIAAWINYGSYEDDNALFELNWGRNYATLSRNDSEGRRETSASAPKSHEGQGISHREPKTEQLEATGSVNPSFGDSLNLALVDGGDFVVDYDDARTLFEDLVISWQRTHNAWIDAGAVKDEFETRGEYQARFARRSA